MNKVIVFLAVLLWLPGVGLALPKGQDFTTPQGIRVVLVEENTLPMVHVRLLVRAGSAYDPPGKEGLTALTAWLLNEGAGDLDSKAFQEKLDVHGIRLAGNPDEDYLEIAITTLSQHLDVAFQLLGLVITAPRFDEEAFLRGREHYLSAIAKREESPGSRAGVVFREKLYQGHPYAHPVAGYKKTMEAITREDVKAFYQRAFRGPDMVLAVAGDLSLARLRELLSTHLADISPEPSDLPAIPLMTATPPGGVQALEMDVPQSAIQWGGVGINRQDPDYFPLIVMNHILGGGGFASRLTEEIREKRGLTYGVYSYFDPMAGRGPFVMALQTKTKSVRQAVALMRREIQRMVKRGVSEEELVTASLDLAGSFALHLDGLGALTRHFSHIVFYHRGMDFLEKYVERIRAVSRQDILRVARRILQPDHFQLVVVGRQAAKQVP